MNFPIFSVEKYAPKSLPAAVSVFIEMTEQKSSRNTGAPEIQVSPSKVRWKYAVEISSQSSEATTR